MYKVILFQLNNEPMVFLRTMIQAFKYFIYELLEVYLDDWMIYGIMKNHAQALQLMFE